MRGSGGRPEGAIEAVAALEDSVRSRLYEATRKARAPLTREQAAAAVGISRKLAAFHLDKLVAAGLLRVAPMASDRPRPVGRTPKAYEPVDDAVSVSIPARTHDDLAAVLVDAVTSARPSESGDETRRRVAAERGRGRGSSVDRRTVKGRPGPERELRLAEAALDAQGYEPYRAAPRCLRLHNCPFHPLAERAPELVCGINHAFLGGFLNGLQADALTAVLAPVPGECCVEITPRG